MSADTGLRLRRLLADNLALVALLALAVTVAGGALTYDGYVADRTTTETRTVTVYETSPAFTHGATVQRQNPVFDIDTRLSGRSVYYERVAPVLSGEYRLSYQAPDGNATVRLTTTLVYQGTADEDATVLWQKRTRLASEETTGLEPGDTATVPYRVNVTETRQRVSAITKTLGISSESVRTLVLVRTELSGTIAGESIDSTHTDRLGIEASDGVYRPTVNATGTSATRRESVTRLVEPGPLRTAGGPLMLAVGLVGLIGLLAGRYGGWLIVSDRERDVLAHQQARDEFDEWITAAAVPDSVLGTHEEHVDVADLEGLVDVAIDTDGRVIEDERRAGFFVVSGDQTYRHDPPTAPTSDVGPLEPAITRIDE